MAEEAFDPFRDTDAIAVPTASDQYIPQTLTTGEEIAAGKEALPRFEHAAQAAGETALGFVPRSLSAVLGFATPVVQGVEDIVKAGKTIRDVASGVPIQDAIEQNIPESQILKQAEQTPPYSKERFAAGFQIALPLGLFAAAPLSESLFPKPKPAFDPFMDAGATPIPNAVFRTTEGVPSVSAKDMRPVAEEPLIQATTPAEEKIASPVAPVAPAELPSYKPVDSSVFSTVQDKQVLDSIVSNIPVDVMDMLGGKQRATEMLLHDPAMFSNSLSSLGLDDVRARIGIDLAKTAATHRAELAASPNSPRYSQERLSALSAIENNAIALGHETTLPRVTPSGQQQIGGEIPSATQKGKQPESYQPEHPGVSPRTNVPENVSQVRQIEGEQAGGRGSVQPSAQEPQEVGQRADVVALAEAETPPAAPTAPEAAKPPFVEGTPEVGGEVSPEQAAASRRMIPTPTEPIQVKPLTALKGVYQAAEKAGTAGYERGFSEAHAEGQSAIAQIKGELGMADRLTAKDQEQVRQNMVEFVNKTLPPAERGRFIGAITRALRRPALGRETGMMYKNAFNVFKAIENRAQDVYRGGLVNDIKTTLSKSLDAPGIDVGYRRQLKAVADSISTTKPTTQTTARLQSLQDFVNRERAAGREPNIPQETLDQLSALTKLPLRDMPLNALEQLSGHVKNLAKLGRLKAKLFENLWERNKGDMMSAMGKEAANPIERRPLYAAQPTEKLTLAQRFMNRVKTTMNGALRFEQAIAPMDEIYDHMGAGGGSYGSFPSKFIKGNLDLAENNKLAELAPIQEQSAALVKKYGLTKADMETVGVKGIVNMIGRERLEAMEVRGDILDRIEKTPLTKGQQAYYDFTRATYDSLGKRVRGVAHKLYQQDMDVVDNYVPLLRDWAAHTDGAVPPAPADPLAGKIPFNETATMDQLRRDFNPKLISRTEQGFLKSRLEGAKTPVELNAEDVFLRHANDALHFIHQQPVIKMLAEVARTPEFQAKYGNLAQNIVLDNLDSVATQGYVNHNQRIAVLDWLRNSTSKGAVGFRIASNIVHSSQIGFEAVHAGGPGWWAKGLRTTLTPEGQRFLRTNAAETYFRGGGEPAQAEVEAMSSVGKAGFYVARNIDKLGAQATFLGRYMKEMSKASVPLDDILNAPVDQQARALALARMHRAVASPMAKDLPQMTSRGVGLGGNVSVARAINQFRNIFLDNWSNIRHDFLRTGVRQMGEVINQLRKGEVAAGAKLVGDAASHRAAIAAAALMGVAMETGIKMGVKKGTTAAMQAATGTEPPPERKGHEEKTYAQEFEHHLINRVPFVGQAASAYMYGESGIPVLDSVINPLKELGTAGKSAAPETQAKHYIRAAKSAATLAGVPGSSQVLELAEPKLTQELGKVVPDRRKTRAGKSGGDYIQ